MASGVIVEAFTDELVERLAAAAHVAHNGAEATAYEGLDDWAKEANRDQVRGIPVLTAALGYRIVSADPADGTVVEEVPGEAVERGAVLEHERWMRFTLGRGYRHGAVRDDLAMTHPDLVPWYELDEPTRDKDRVRVRTIPSLLRGVGLHLVRPGC